MTIKEVLTRGVEKILPNQEGLAQLMAQKKIRLYLGIDPTGNQLHLGHAVVLRKLQQFADLGHDVILLIGNGTVKIGDPTGKDKTRPLLTDEVIEANFSTWKEQAAKVLNFDQISIKRNGDWLDPLNFADIVKLMAKFTVQQLLERDMFQKRLKHNQPIFAHEIIYPILQGYDSVAMDVDLEIGGSDQLFNMMVGRQLQKDMNNRDKFVLGVPLLVGSDGRKMGKSLNNFISLTAEPNDMYGKVMSIVDDVIIEYFTLLTDVPLAEIESMQAELKSGANPMVVKKRLALTITTQYHSVEAAHLAQEQFERTVQNRELPQNLPTLTLASGATVLDAVMGTAIPTSNSEGRRLIEQGGVSLDDERLTDPNQELSPKSGQVLRVGKRQWFAVK